MSHKYVPYRASIKYLVMILVIFFNFPCLACALDECAYWMARRYVVTQAKRPMVPAAVPLDEDPLPQGHPMEPTPVCLDKDPLPLETDSLVDVGGASVPEPPQSIARSICVLVRQIFNL